MSARTIRLIQAAFLCLVVGIGAGVVFAFDRGAGALWRPLHAEANLWGAVTLLIYGMAYHMLPRFAGRPLRSERLAEGQSWAAMVGVATVLPGCLGLRGDVPGAAAIVAAGGVLQWLSALVFIYLAIDLLFLQETIHGNRQTEKR